MRRREQRRFSPGLNLNISLSTFSYVDERHADHRNPPTWSLMTGDRNACDQHQRNRSTRQDAQLPMQANPARNFWAVSQGESARNAIQRRRFPRSEKLTANSSRRKPPRSPGPMAKSAPFSCKTAQNPQGHDHGQGLGSRKRRCGRASDIAGSCQQARPQQPPAPTANGAPAATWTRPCSKSSHIAECVCAYR